SEQTPARELAQRLSGTNEVVLLWHPDNERVEVAVRDRETGVGFALDVAPGRAIDAFYHPYASTRLPGPTTSTFEARSTTSREPDRPLAALEPDREVVVPRRVVSGQLPQAFDRLAVGAEVPTELLGEAG